MSTDGDGVDADDFLGQSFCNGPKSNLKQHPIRVVICDGDYTTASNSMALDLGNKNTLTSINQTGGDTGGGNVMVTYSFRNFNNFTIQASGTYKDGLKIDNGTLSMQSLPESAPVAPAVSYNYFDNTDQ